MNGEHDPVPNHAARKVVAWEEPPPAPQTGRRPYEEIAEQLRANPGKWARLEDRNSAAAAQVTSGNIRYGHISSFRPAGAFDARYEDRSLWARYIGEDGS